jgi:hypothetical protein|tara:strand:- start:2059 stop:2526 length:468 start_codon:yes stop_codon:yes gene_type:complete
MSISSKLKEIIDEIIGEEQNICEQCGEVHEGECVKEASTTGNVAGYETPNAFGSDKEKENATNSTGYTIVKELYNQNYPSFKKDETKNSRQKVNGAIKEINRKLFEIERIIGRAAKLKTEDGVSSDNYWKSTKPRMTKIAERLMKVSHKLREIAS